MTQSHWTIDPDATGIRAAVGHGHGHAFKRWLLVNQVLAKRKPSSNTAHIKLLV
jgi:hypothetical protein